MKRNYSTWTYEQDKKLVDLRAAGIHHDKIGPRLARTASSCKARLQWHGASTIKGAQLVASENRYGQRFGKDIGHRIVVDPALCPSIVAVRDQYYEALSRRDLTATICGDPTPGRAELLAQIEAEDKTR